MSFDEAEVEQSDLRGGHSPWVSSIELPFRTPKESFRCDVVIVGAGITGALMAERLTRQGLHVAVVERERAARGSTAASTAMLLWEIDQSLHDLSERYGFERAARAYRASFDAMAGLQALLQSLGAAGSLRARPSLYLAADCSPKRLQDEIALRHRAGLPGVYLDHQRLAAEFAMVRPAALLSPGAADADPVALTESLLSVAASRRAALVQAEAVAYDAAAQTVSVGLDGGYEIEARHVVLATGYAMPDFVCANIQQTNSSWAIATRPQPQHLWPREALIWEDASTYIYARTTLDGRIVFGGEDDDVHIEPDQRDALIPQKTELLKRKLAALWPRAERSIEFAWSGAFDTTKDGLPLIGPVPGRLNTYAAYGYGGNGITFSYLAAELLGNLIGGKSSPLLTDFALDRE